MSTAPGAASTSSAAVLGIGPGSAVQELGWDSDVDDALRTDILDSLGEDFVYEAIEAVDVVLLWWRDDDGDLGDGLVDALTDLSASGYLWLFSPRVGRDGYVDPSDLAEAALTAGLALANTTTVSKTWQAQKLVRPKGSRR
ncbi:DUF3052 family protein [Propionicimonas sp.]|uniref:DUF3052 family protein n=1 Tax=Propionicimonas sp. TaxID=1955623 RepID=UPI0017CA310B|nr:DUF3052 domain-containing protein [Propionicimonas sp.]MBU3976153.1 DUF3052 domain-containing protein [Actinomycetota bacterium]MBU3985548.1 DUF3052 domain-containing protein [Actinomycetota bacterium]MBU4008333.1 DUF3052 domain-containing protein [Actinomycetota bacterium]MBU4066517.1 DUF3052 domain-containing protein [Actinomycetota bacterium]